jgi:hypothetical protein
MNVYERQGKGSDEFKALQKAAQSLRGKLPVAFSEKEIGGFKVPAIQVCCEHHLPNY